MSNKQMTAEELQALKDNWRLDPCWDIEDTEGFEYHYDELKEYRLSCEAEWNRMREAKEIKEASEMGIQTNPLLYKYLKGVEFEISELKEELAKLKGDKE